MRCTAENQDSRGRSDLSENLYLPLWQFGYSAGPRARRAARAVGGGGGGTRHSDRWPQRDRRCIDDAVAEIMDGKLSLVKAPV